MGKRFIKEAKVKAKEKVPQELENAVDSLNNKKKEMI